MNEGSYKVMGKTLSLIVNLTFVLLAVTITTTVLKNDSYREDVSVYKAALDELKLNVTKANRANLLYIEEKVNRVAVNQDSYQVNTTRRVEVLEERIKALQESSKASASASTRVVNNNTAIVNQ